MGLHRGGVDVLMGSGLGAPLSLPLLGELPAECLEGGKDEDKAAMLAHLNIQVALGGR